MHFYMFCFAISHKWESLPLLLTLSRLMCFADGDSLWEPALHSDRESETQAVRRLPAVPAVRGVGAAQ